MMKKSWCSRIDDYRKLLRILFMAGTSLELLAISSVEFSEKKRKKPSNIPLFHRLVDSTLRRHEYCWNCCVTGMRASGIRVQNENKKENQIQNNTWNAKYSTTKNAATIKTCTVTDGEEVRRHLIESRDSFK